MIGENELSSFVTAAFETWKKQINQPYRWGGNDPMEGWDCSGLVIEGLKSVGLLPYTGDWRARDLAVKWPEIRAGESLHPGMLVFYNWVGRETIAHVEVIWRVLEAGSRRVIQTLGASGGGPRTTSSTIASQRDAYVKLRPWRFQHVVKITDPFHEVR